MRKEKSLELHRILGGKIGTRVKTKIDNRKILSLVYTPGVAEAVKAIAADSKEAYSLTIKKDTVGVITDGSAVLGLGNKGALAAIPVMEGKCALFRTFAGINAFPICLATQNSREIVAAVRAIAPVFAAINLEDIKSPKCFVIEAALQDLGIPVVHDDQHATAIIATAGLINACKVTGKNLKQLRIAVLGVGAAGTAIIKLLHHYGCSGITAVDRKGIIHKKRPGLNVFKTEIAAITNPENLRGNFAKAANGADALIGVSQKGLFPGKLIKSMSAKPIIFALANPDPEIARAEALESGAYIYASGRSDDPNQINNALVFPGFFKGLIENRITRVSEDMKLKAAYAIAGMVKCPSRERFVPDIFDPGLADTLAKSLWN